MNDNSIQEAGDKASLKAILNVTTLVYILQAFSFLLGVTAIAAVIVNYIKRDDAQGTLVASHFRWQIRTFWFGLLWTVVGGILSFIGIGLIVLAGTYIWVIYRVVRGWLALNDSKEMYQ